ncbi:hypothetical protein OIU78_007216 [Salix suchowensis]|nr:hypothetical protein OIU78_007216 [Salix suchowensis]
MGQSRKLFRNVPMDTDSTRTGQAKTTGNAVVIIKLLRHSQGTMAWNRSTICESLQNFSGHNQYSTKAAKSKGSKQI